MLYTIKNDFLTVTVNSFGAELTSVKNTEGTEYIWQGGDWWPDRSPVLFPTCGNVPTKKYFAGGKEYTLPIHGIAMYREFTLVESSQDRLLFSLKSDEKTLLSYPFEFEFFVEFILSENTLSVNLIPENRGDKIMPCMTGWHPGFILWADDEIGEFSVDFGKGASKLSWFPLTPGRPIPLHPTVHGLRDGKYYLNEEEIYKNDTMIFTDYPKTFSLKDKSGYARISMSVSENIPYFCIWKEASAEARFVCLEPWSHIFNCDGTTQNLDTRPMPRLSPGERAVYSYKVFFN